MKKRFVCFFFSLGFVSLIAQVIILRELIVSFYGHELFIGLILGIWLLETSLGSLIAHKLPFKGSPFWLLLLVILGFPLIILLTRLFWGSIFSPGELPSLFFSLAAISLILFPFCFLLGIIFTLGTRFWAKKRVYQVVSRAYFWETIGLVTAGLTFNFFLINSSFPFPAGLNNRTLKSRWPNLIESVNSRYGNITVTQTNQQYNFYESGILVGSSQDKEVSEYFVHPILSQQEKPRKVLLIGGGLTGVLQEILKYPNIEAIDYLELDPQLIAIQKKYLPIELTKVLQDPRLSFHFLDGRQFLKTSHSQYDLVIFNLPNPSTVLLNRFYTQECFQEVKKRLTEKGVLAFNLDLPSDYLSQEAISLASSINQTAKTVFEQLTLFPEETKILFLASVKAMPQEPELIVSRFKKQAIKTDFFTPGYLFYLLTSDKIGSITKKLEKEKTTLNQDLYPIAYFYENSFWQTTFSFTLAKMVRSLDKLDLSRLISFLLIIIIATIIVLKRRVQILFYLTATAGLTLIGFELLLIAVFQAKLGYIFSKIALIFALILGFTALGNLTATKARLSPKKGLNLAIIFILGFSFAFTWLIQKLAHELIFYGLSALIGFLAGMIFPLTNQLYLNQDKQAIKKTGILYSADLLGAFFGAFLSSLFLMPVLGIVKTAGFLGVVNGLSLILLQKLEP